MACSSFDLEKAYMDRPTWRRLHFWMISPTAPAPTNLLRSMVVRPASFAARSISFLFLKTFLIFRFERVGTVEFSSPSDCFDLLLISPAVDFWYGSLYRHITPAPNCLNPSLHLLHVSR